MIRIGSLGGISYYILRNPQHLILIIMTLTLCVWLMGSAKWRVCEACKYAYEEGRGLGFRCLVFRVSKSIGMVYILIRFCLAASTPNKTCVRWFDIICSKNETSSGHLVSEFRVSAYLRLGH